MLRAMLVIGLGGFLGANARYLLALWSADRFGTGFPYGTMIINVTGSFLIGLLVTLVDRLGLSDEYRLLFVVGFLGAYTTFSTFSFEALALVEAGRYLTAAGYIAGSVLLGLLAVTAGLIIARFVS